MLIFVLSFRATYPKIVCRECMIIFIWKCLDLTVGVNYAVFYFNFFFPIISSYWGNIWLVQWHFDLLVFSCLQKVSECMQRSAEHLQNKTLNDAESALAAIDEALLISTYSEKLLEMKAEALFRVCFYIFGYVKIFFYVFSILLRLPSIFLFSI